VLLAGDSAQHRSVERGDALRILEQSASVRYVEWLQTQRQKVPALKAAIEDLKAGRLRAGWEKLSQCRTVEQVVVLADGVDAKGWYVSLSRARAMHVYTRNKAALRQSVM
jgi:hypothetical protein